MGMGRRCAPKRIHDGNIDNHSLCGNLKVGEENVNPLVVITANHWFLPRGGVGG
jgi:hypothetical protein